MAGKKDKGRHRGEPSKAVKKRAEANKQSEDVEFWRDAAEDSGVLPHDPDDPRNKRAPTPGKHRRRD